MSTSAAYKSWTTGPISTKFCTELPLGRVIIRWKFQPHRISSSSYSLKNVEAFRKPKIQLLYFCICGFSKKSATTATIRTREDTEYRREKGAPSGKRVLRKKRVLRIKTIGIDGESSLQSSSAQMPEIRNWTKGRRKNESRSMLRTKMDVTLRNARKGVRGRIGV